MLVVMLSGCMLPRSTSISSGLQAGSLGAAAFQSGSSSKVNCKASSLLFNPSRHTARSSCFNSLCICSWWSQPWTSALCVPSIIALTYPSLDRGAWDMASFSHTKAYGQSVLSSTSSTSLWATSSTVWKQAWRGCAHTVVRPKIL